MTNKMQLLAYSLLMGIIIVLAYVGLIPTKLHDIPNYDAAGHCILYGFWGYFFGKAFSKPIVSIGNFKLQTGIAIAVLIAIAEEFLQQLPPIRSFSFYDLAFGLFGIALACGYLNICRNQSSTISPN